MQRDRGGYTVIEVMVVLAVGMATFFAAASLLTGRQGKTEFSQAMHDIQTRVQSIINDVRVSSFPDASNYTCEVGGSGRPNLSGGSSGAGTNTECIFLGKALHLIPSADPDRMDVYPVLGSRLARSGDPPTTYDSDNNTGVNPESITDISDLIETYTLPFGVTMLSARENTTPATETYLMGFYNSLQSSATDDQGSQVLTTIGYIGFNEANPNQARTAIRGVGSGSWPLAFSKSWTICFESGTSTQNAELVVNASFSGVTASVNYTDCS